MEEWKECKLGNIANIQTGPFGSQLHKSDYKPTGIPCIMPCNISANLDVCCDNIAYISEEDAKRLCKHKTQTGDIIYSRRGDIEKCAYISEKESGWVCGTGCLKIRIDSEKANPKFIAYQLSTHLVKSWIVGSAVGTTMLNLNTSILTDCPISLPSLPTQQKIANILSSLDDKIEVNRRINEQLEELAGALFKSWFVDFEPFKDGNFVESELGKLGSVVNTTSGGTPSRKHMEYYGGNYGWVKSKELNGTFIIDTEETITDDAIAKSSAKILPEKSILIAMYGATVGQYAILSKPMTCNQAVCALLPNDNYPYTFLFMFAKNKKDELINKAVGSAQQNISQILIKDLDVSTDTKKIKEFHRIVKPAFEVILKNQQEITHLTTLRDTLLPKLMSGEIDVNEVKI